MYWKNHTATIIIKYLIVSVNDQPGFYQQFRIVLFSQSFFGKSIPLLR